tara:strand:- start:679 stop:1662 length:984 start_codon:yes stop_codon:yes gene_type:complete
MATAAAIETSYKNMFKEGFEQAFQQSNSRLRPYVEVESQASEFDYYDRVGLADDMSEDTQRYGDNPVNEIPHDRRRIGLRDFELGKPIDEKDLIRVVSDPTNAYTTAMVASAHRKVDDLIITGLTDIAYTGKAGGTSVLFASDTANKITVGSISNEANNVTTAGKVVVEAGTEGIYISSDYTGGAAVETGLTIEKMKAVRATMLRLEAITQDTVINAFVTSSQISDLLGEDKLINLDYAAKARLEEGKVTEWGGFRFIHSERLPKTGDVRSCFFTLPRAYKLSIGKDITADIWRLSGQKNIPYIYIKLAMGGSRMWGEVLAVVDCNE